MTAQLPPSPLPSAFLACPGGIFLSFPCSEEASGEDVLSPLPPFVPPAVSTCAAAVEVLLDVALPLPLALPPLALVAVLWDAAVDDRPVLALGEAPAAEPLPDPSPPPPSAMGWRPSRHRRVGCSPTRQRWSLYRSAAGRSRGGRRPSRRA